MIGYDIGVRFDLDEASVGVFGGVDARYNRNFENLLPTGTLMDTTREISPLPLSSNVAEPDAALNAESEVLHGMRGRVGTGGGAVVDALSHSGRPSFIPGDGNHPDAVQRALAGYERYGMGASVGDVLAALFLPGHSGMLADMPRGFGETTGSGNADITGNAAAASRGMPIQKSNMEMDSGFSLIDEVTSAAGNGQGPSYVQEIPGLWKGQSVAEYTYPQLPKPVERDEDPGSVLDAIRNFDYPANLKTAYGPPATNIAGGGSNAVGGLVPTGMVANDPTESDNALRDSEGLFHDVMRTYNRRDSQFSENDGKALCDRIIDAFEGAFSESPTPSNAAKEIYTADFGAAIAGLDRRFNQFSDVGATGTDKRAIVREDGIPEGAGTKADEASKSQSDFSALLPSRKIPHDEDTTGLTGLWEMLCNAERFLPRQSITGQRSQEVTGAGLSEGQELGLPGLLDSLLARGNVTEFDPETPDMRATRLSADGGRSGPSGNKNDPIYIVAVNQATGTLMPTVSTAGTSTRSPAMPGQRNLP